MLGVSAIHFRPRFNNLTFLRVIQCIVTAYFRIETTFISIGPNHDRWMIDIACYHRLYQAARGRGVILILPTSQFIYNKQS